MERVDSGYVKNGIFRLNGVVPNGPREYAFSFDRMRQDFDIHTYRGFNIVIDNGDKITLKCDSDISKADRGVIDEFIQVEGSAFQTSARALLPAYFFYDRVVKNMRKSADILVDSIGFDGPILTGIYNSIDKINNAFYEEIFTDVPEGGLSDGLSRAFLLLSRGLNINSKHASFLSDRYQSLTVVQKESYYGRMLKEFAALCVGQSFPEFNLQKPDGKPMSLKEVVAKSTLTIVEFWAEESVDRKKYQDQLRQLYRKYHDKGLNIIGFSSDKYGEQWRQVLEKEHFPWYNVSDLKGKEGMVNNVYHEYGDPVQPFRNTTNVLIDPQGRIVAWDVVGAELQWYVWKYLEKK